MWVFADGTEVDTDGTVRGTSPLAEELRTDLAESLYMIEANWPPEPFTRSDPRHVWWVVRNCSIWSRTRLVSGEPIPLDLPPGQIGVDDIA